MKGIRTRGRRILFVASIFGLLAGCSPVSPPQASPGSPFPKNPIETIDSVAIAYVRVAVALGERDPDSLDFAVVPPALIEAIHRSYPSYEAIGREASRLLSLVSSMSLDDTQQLRARFIKLQLQAIHARILILQGRSLDFASEARILFHTELLPDTSSSSRAAVRHRIANLLPTRTSPAPDTLSARYAAYDRQFLIPPNRLPTVLNAALQACRRQTLTYIALPPGESVDLNFVRNKPWSAFSLYQGHAHSIISINVAFPVTVDQALELACHEGYPGHHVFNTLRDIALVQQNHWPEAEVQPTFSPQSYLSESAAAFAPRLVFTQAERIAVERDILFPLADLPPREAERYVTISTLVRTLDSAEPRIAEQYLDGQLEFARATQVLQQETLMEHSKAALLYLNEYRSYMLAYTDGPRRIARLIGISPRPQEAPDMEQRRREWQQYTGLAVTSAP